MARREITQYFDDIDGTPLTDDQVHTVRFSVDGSDYIMDLSEDNATRFLELLAPYVKAAQPAPAARKSRTRATGGAKRLNSRRIRQWAQEQNIEVSDRGTIPKHIIEAYNEAHSS
ncbi:histone-like nucleoid-structuring protein Lsr2 [Corynebacterium testudinoris]|uniref:Lsr2 n=1 Tax=Corynebacterium testudinoris TaxID=136857 RepID=A0A0G3HA77_9CORY|nr:Lsr2 family protein [Corynebacterium testudinoris]AKK08803.1 Lsr2 [Corynebacterium testudinoris]